MALACLEYHNQQDKSESILTLPNIFNYFSCKNEQFTLSTDCAEIRPSRDKSAVHRISERLIYTRMRHK